MFMDKLAASVRSPSIGPSMKSFSHPNSIGLKVLLLGVLLPGPVGADQLAPWVWSFNGIPAPGGWTAGPYPISELKAELGPAGQTITYLELPRGHVQSPAVPVKPYRYYALEFPGRAATHGHLTAMLFDKQEKPLAAGNYDHFFSSASWELRKFVFRAHPDAATARIQFVPDKSPLHIAGLHLKEISWQEVLQWKRELATKYPPVGYVPPPERGSYLPKTRSRLSRGGTLRVVMLGDSIANDTSNSLFETELKNRFRNTRFEVVTSVRGGTLSTWYQHENRVQEYVLRHKPDLLIIAGISHQFDLPALESVIRQVRGQSTTDILLLTDAITPSERMQRDFVGGSRLGREVATTRAVTYPERLRAMAAREKIELMEMRLAWEEYLKTSPQPQQWYMRDEIHANVYGKQVVGTILARYLNLP